MAVYSTVRYQACYCRVSCSVYKHLLGISPLMALYCGYWSDWWSWWESTCWICDL